MKLRLKIADSLRLCDLYLCGLCLWLTFVPAALLSDSDSELNHGASSQTCSTNEPNAENACHRQIRYIIYNVNPGEGFNLRRDVYVRIAPLIRTLNENDKHRKWILVLPPWSNVPHWSTRKVFSWSTFFQLDKINEYIPAIEFEDFMDDDGLQNGIDAVFQLQHFPFNQNEEWRDKLELGVECQDVFPYQLDEYGENYMTTLWNQRIRAKQAECVALRGTAATLLNFLLESAHRSVLFEHAEVILWDSYGDRNWWMARKSLQFAAKLQEIAETFIRNELPAFNLTWNGNASRMRIFGNSFLGVHLRRRDFLRRNPVSETPTIKSIAAQVYSVMQVLDIYIVFVASDAFQSEIEELKSELAILADGETNDDKVPYLFQYRSLDLSEGEIAIVDQILCSWASYFIGTKESTFTTRIFEEREILGCFDPKFTFNSFCADVSESKCEQPTRWRMNLEVR